MSGLKKREGPAALREHFEFFDRDRDGSIDFLEFKALLEAIAPDTDLGQIGAGFSIVDRDNDGHISLDEFERWWCSDWERV